MGKPARPRLAPPQRRHVILLLLLIGMVAGIVSALPRAGLAAPPVQGPTPAATLASDWARAQAAGRLVVGTSADYQPFEYYHSAFDLDGFDIQLMRAMGKKMGVQIEFQDFAFGSLLDALRLGQVDAVISAMSVTPDRQEIVDFSNLYYIGNDAALVRNDSGIAVRSAADLRDRTIAVERGTTYQYWAQQKVVDAGLTPQENLIPFDGLTDMVNAVRDGEVDVALMGYLPARDLDLRDPVLTVGGSKFNSQQFAIAVRKGSDLAAPLNAALLATQADGAYAELVEDYLALDTAEVQPADDGLIPLPTPQPTATPNAAPASIPTATQPAPAAPAAPAGPETATPPPTTAPATPTATTLPPTPTATPTPPPCILGLAYVSDLNFDDHGMTTPPIFGPGQLFTKGWRVLNSGTCQWEPDFQLMYVNGNRSEARMEAQPVPVGRVVPPGETVDLYANLRAPQAPGTFQAFWQMRDNKGVFFGQTLWVGIAVPDPNPPPTPTPVPQPPQVTGPINPNLRADSSFVNAGQCTTIRWDVDFVNAVYFVENGNAQGKGGHDAITVCPTTTTAYELRVVRRDGVTEVFTITINVGSSPGGQYWISFWADSTEISRNQCTTLRWDVQNVREVYLNGEGVGGVGSREVCPVQPTTYELRVVRLDGGQETRQVTIVVRDDDSGGGGDGGSSSGGDKEVPVGHPRVDWFRVDRNSISNGKCVELSWRASDADGINVNRGETLIVQGAFPDDKKKDCPPGPGWYEYRLDAYNRKGNDSATLTVEVRP